MGTCAYALQECVRPDVKTIKSLLEGTVLRLRLGKTIKMNVRTSKCTAQPRPASMKKFAKKVVYATPAGQQTYPDGDVDMDGTEGERDVYVQLKTEREYYINRKDEGGEDEKEEVDEDQDETA